MKVIGLCGGSGSGKGAVSSIFDDLGIPSIDTDAVYREMTLGDSPCLRALAIEFGDEIISANGSLDRARLASIVFSGEGCDARRRRLNEIAHYFILEETRRRLKEYESLGCIAALVDAPVLFESGFDKECDKIICVLADKDTRVERIVARDGISRQAAKARINSQMSDEELISRCDYVIYNNCDLESLKSSVLEIKNNF